VWGKIAEFLVLMEVVCTITTVLEGVNEDIKTLNVLCNVFRHTVSQITCYRRSATVMKVGFSGY
jgi:hypothetical protein